jgi:hypothetical protein
VETTAVRLLQALERGGLLLLQDKTFPNVAALVAGEAVSGSWWSHARGHEIFRAVSELARHPDVLVCKLIAGKVTFVQRRLWPAVLAVARSGESWQTAGLAAETRSLLEEVEREGSIVASGKAAQEIESRLLAHGEQIHTELGNHKIRLETWAAWSNRAGCEPDPSACDARSRLERIVVEAGGSLTSLPWCAARRAKRPGRRTTDHG